MFRSKNQRQARKASHQPRRRQIETLEERRLMAVDLDQSVFSPEAFIEAMDFMYEDNIMGYAYTVNYNGEANADVGFGGWARSTLEDSPLLYFPSTRIEVASVSKIITTVATLQLLEQVYGDIDYGLDRPLMSFLPTDWGTGDNVEWITMRHLLRHTSGYGEGGNNDAPNEAGINFENFNNNNWSNLQTMLVQDHIATDVVADPDYVTPRWPRRYNNANFTLLSKVVIPKLLDMEQDYTAANLAAAGITDPDAFTGQLYADYVRANVFEPLGILGASMDINEGSTANALSYSGPNDITPGVSMTDEQDNGGAFGWKLSANDLGRFVHGVEYNNSILSASARQLMHDENLGWSPQGAGDGSAQRIVNAFGPLYNHGGLRGFGGGSRMLAEIMVFPGGIEAAVVINSNRGLLPLANPDDTLHAAYTNAWTDIVFDGTDEADDFEIRLSTSVGRPSLELVMNGDVQFSRWIDTLDTLTINGLGGNDTFDVDALPAGVELVINGGQHNDVLTLADVSGNLEAVANVTFNGGSGNDSMTINDANNAYDTYLNSRYNITATTLWRGAATGNPADPLGEARVDYSGVEHLELTTGDQADDFYVASTVAISTTINASGGDDSLFASPFGGKLDAVAGLQFNGDDGTDSVLINDMNNPYDTALNSQYEVSSTGVSRYGSHPVPQVPFVTKAIGFQATENLTLFTGDNNDVVNVASTPDGETLIETGGGSDTLYVTQAAGNLELAAGLTFNAGTGSNNSLIIHDENNPYETLVNRPYSVTPVSVTRYAAQPGLWLGAEVGITYSGVQTLELNTGDESDTIEVHGLQLLGDASSIDATFNTAGGDDTLVVTPNDGNMEYVEDLQFNGGEGSDSVIVHDENNTYATGLNGNYTVTSSSVSRYRSNANIWTPFAETAINFDGVEHVQLHAGAGGDTIQVEDVESLDSIAIYGGNPTRTPGDTLQLLAPPAASTAWVPSNSEFGAGQAMIDETMISYWEIETVDTDFATPNPESDAFGDFDGNGVVDGDDLTHPLLGYHARYGNGLNGSHFMAWMQHHGQKVPAPSNTKLTQSFSLLVLDDATLETEPIAAAVVTDEAPAIWGAHGLVATKERTQSLADRDIAFSQYAGPEHSAEVGSLTPTPLESTKTSQKVDTLAIEREAKNHELAVDQLFAEFESEALVV